MENEKIATLVPFTLDHKKYALKAQCIEQVVPAAEVTTLPDAPEAVMGIIDLHGTIVPVFDIRKRFKLRTKQIALSDIFIIARTSSFTAVLVVDSIEMAVEYPLDAISSIDEITGKNRYIEGIVKLPDGMILIHDIEAFLSAEEKKQLDRSLEKQYGKEKS